MLRLSPSSLASALICLCLCLSLSACRKPVEKETAAEPIRLAVSYWPGSYWIDVAKHKDWFTEAGLNVTVVDVNDDFFGSFQMLADGQLDGHAPPIFDFVRLNAEGHKIIGVLVTDYTQGAEAIVARPGIESMRDLRGKRLGLTLNTYAEHVFGVLAERDSVPVEEVQLVDIVGEKAHEEFIAGNVDAVFVWVPLIDPALEGVPGSKIIFSSKEMPGLSGGIQCFRQEFVEKRPEDVRKILQVWKRASEYLRTNPEEAYAIVAETNGVPVDQVRAFPELDRILDVRDNEATFSFSSGFDSIHGNVRRINDFMLRKGITSRDLDTVEILDGQFVRELGTEQR